MPELKETMPQEEKRRHRCGAPRSPGEGGRAIRDEEGCCKECGVPIDEDGFETVDPEADQVIRDYLEGNIANNPEKLLARLNNPDIRKIVEDHYRRKGRIS